ncbi:unnamed protein product [Rotaria sp. Silwood2]|nr:unnamed protein product [Rotaria sp. Silwood2]CAF4374478.1 unnamed protein product [Rotaria sp. Silwood2]
MDESQNSAALIHTPPDTQLYLSVSSEPNIKYKPMPDPLSIYVPLDSLTEDTIDSIVSTTRQLGRDDWSLSKRTLLAFLLAINNKVSEIEKGDSNNKFNEQTVRHAAKVRQWLVQKDRSGNIKKLDWNELQETYQRIAREKYDGTAKYFDVENAEPYSELTIGGLHPDVNQSRKYIARFRSHGWQPNELKIYWNVQQLENLCPKHETQAKQGEEKDEEKTRVKLENNEEVKDEVKTEVRHENLPPHDPSDADVVQDLRQHPVSKRNNAGNITYVNKGIQNAVFDIPEGAQIILLNFAVSYSSNITLGLRSTFQNERSPGGGYLRHAWAQEEILLYNSDGYRALLDLKYGRMGGGYAIPEFGLAYVRDIRIFDKKTGKIRQADMLVSACYCLTGSPQLYAIPKSQEEWETKNLAKFQAFIAAAVANTKGDGSNTYLLLGPIGTGAFGNNVTQIGNVFCKVLKSNMMGSNGPISKAFENICVKSKV